MGQRLMHQRIGKIVGWSHPDDPGTLKVIRRRGAGTEWDDLLSVWRTALTSSTGVNRSPQLQWLRDIQLNTSLSPRDLVITQLFPVDPEETFTGSLEELHSAELRLHVEHGLVPSATLVKRGGKRLTTEHGGTCRVYFAYRLTGEGADQYHVSTSQPSRRLSWFKSTAKRASAEQCKLRGAPRFNVYSVKLAGEWELELIGMSIQPYVQKADQWLDDLINERILS